MVLFVSACAPLVFSFLMGLSSMPNQTCDSAVKSRFAAVEIRRLHRSKLGVRHQLKR